jgi:hypothetical protein
VALLAELHAFIDIDQYWLSPESEWLVLTPIQVCRYAPAGERRSGIMRSAMIQAGRNIWRPRLDSQCVGSAAVTILGTVALLLGCRGSSGSDEDASTPEALADAAGCANITELDAEIAPIRGKAATRGISCDLDGEVVHIFARAPIGDSSAVGLRPGGTLDNIRRLLGAGDSSCSLALLVSDDLFIVASSDDVLSDLGIPGEPPVRVSPTVSYLDHCTLRPSHPVTVTGAKRPWLPFGVGYLATHTWSVASCAASTVSNRPTVVMGERPGGSSSRT